jgi:hypothetical protein
MPSQRKGDSLGYTTFTVKWVDTPAPWYTAWARCAACACPLNMFLAPLWLHKMHSYFDTQTHIFVKSAKAFEQRKNTEVTKVADIYSSSKNMYSAV